MKKALLSTQIIVKSETAKYVYTVEFQPWSTETWHLHYLNEMDCTVYDTVEDAQAAIHETAVRWHWDERRVFLKKYTGSDLLVLHHRHVVRPQHRP